MNPTTSVVRIRKQGGVVTQDCDLYIGRACHQGGWNLKASKWCNPYPVNTYGREEACRLYEEYVRRGILYSQLDELEGKVLGCWCDTGPCHGEILIKLLDEKKSMEAFITNITNLSNYINTITET